MKNGFVRTFGSAALILASVYLSGCTTGNDGDPYKAAQYKTQDRTLSTQPWSKQEKWEKGGMLGGYADPRYQQ